MRKCRLFLALFLSVLLVLTGSVHAAQAEAQTFEGAGHGMQGPITVNVTVDEGKITGIEFLVYTETGNITAVAKERIPALIMEHQSLGLDAVTGATLTSYGIINAVANAAEKAGLDVKAMRTQKADVAERHLANSKTIFLRLVEKVRSFPKDVERQCIEARDYEALEMAVIEHLMGK